MYNHFNNLKKKEKGQGLVEYALILVLVAIVVIAALMILGPIIGNVFSNINSSLGDLGSNGGGGGGNPIVSAPPDPPASVEGDAARRQYCAERPGYTGGVNWGFAGGHTWTNNGQTYTVDGSPFNCSDYQ